jgi:hypothetical protein
MGGSRERLIVVQMLRGGWALHPGIRATG